MNRKFKGIWIPAEVWLSPELTLQEKVFYAEIDSLSDDEEGCYATNDYFADFFGISIVRVSQVISSLVKKGYVVSRIDKAQGNKRFLSTLLKESLIPPIKEKFNTSLRKVKDPIKEKFNSIYKEDNKTDNKTDNNLSPEGSTTPEPLEEKKNKKTKAPQPPAAADSEETKTIDERFGHKAGAYKEGWGDGVLAHAIGDYLQKNPGKYSREMCLKFLGYYTALVQSGKAKGKELWRTNKTFSLAGRLATWAGKEYNQTPAVSASNSSSEFKRAFNTEITDRQY